MQILKNNELKSIEGGASIVWRIFSGIVAGIEAFKRGFIFGFTRPLR